MIKGGPNVQNSIAYWGDQYAAGISLGYSGLASQATGKVYISNTSISGYGGSPWGNYKLKNFDGIVAEIGIPGIYLKNVTIDGASDGGLDMKSPVMVKDSTISNTYRSVRLRAGINYFANVNFTNAYGQFLAIENPTTKVIFYNCTFDGQNTIPAGKIDYQFNATASQIQYVNTLPDVFTQDPFFLN
jgi:hypothetical protein